MRTVKRKVLNNLIIMTIGSLFLSNSIIANEQSHILDLTYNSYTPFSSITILNDANFTDYGFAGDGSALFPYLIEGLNITTSEDYGIYIEGVTKSFIIRDCYINATDTAISLNYVNDENVEIQYNTLIQNNLYGVLSMYCSGILIANNEFYMNNHGICSVRSSNNISTNYFENNTINGIWLYEDNSSVVSNECKHNGERGIYIQNSYGNYIAENICYEHSTNGISVSNSYLVTILGNTCFQNSVGISSYGCYNITVVNNDCSEAVYTSYGFCIIVTESENATIHKNYVTNNPHNTGIIVSNSPFTVISNNTILNARGISLTAQSNNSTIMFNMIVDGLQGIYVAYTNFSKIFFNLAEECVMTGITLDHVYFSEIHHNTLVNNAINAEDEDGGNNIWYDISSLEGNYYSDYSGIGSYTISGTTNSIDLYPLGTITISEFAYSNIYIYLTVILASIFITINIKRRKNK